MELLVLWAVGGIFLYLWGIEPNVLRDLYYPRALAFAVICGPVVSIFLAVIWIVAKLADGLHFINQRFELSFESAKKFINKRP